MNIQNMNSAIAIMLRAKERNSVCMRHWQETGDSILLKVEELVTTEEEFHACGNKACFAGHIAVSPEFHASGGWCAALGVPNLGNTFGVYAIQEWLEVSELTAHNLVHGDCIKKNGRDYSQFYNKLWVEVSANDVLEKLYALKAEYESLNAIVEGSKNENH